MIRHDLTAQADGDAIAVWHYPAEADAALTGPAGRPCVVMAHGLGATRDSGLDGFAEALSAAGVDVLAFDYRGFGDSGGEPRQHVSAPRQQADYHAVIALARSLADIDPERIVVWGVSFAGGHVLQVAAKDGRLAGVISLTPAVDGLTVLRGLLRREGPVHAGRLVAAGLRDRRARLSGGSRYTVPVMGPSGTVAAITGEGAVEKWPAVAGPTWRNEICADVLLDVGLYRPIRAARQVKTPLLMQIADFDETAPPGVALRAARRGRAEVRHYPADHFDVYPGGAVHAAVCAHQVHFLRRHLASSVPVAASVG